MRRNAFKMKLKPGCEAEYKKRHDEIWPELEKLIKDSGIYDYSIYFDEETLTLFACQKLTDNNSLEKIPESPIMKKWWAHMADLMETNPNKSPVVKLLREVYHID